MNHSLIIQVGLLAAATCLTVGCKQSHATSQPDAKQAAVAPSAADVGGTPNLRTGDAAATGNGPTAPANMRAAENCAQLASQFGGRLEMYLDLSKSKITDDDLATLEVPEEVVKIDLSHTAITDKGLAYLKTRAPHLGELELLGTRITDAGLEHLKSMDKLWRVSIEQTSVSAPGHLALLEFLTPRVQARMAAQNAPTP